MSQNPLLFLLSTEEKFDSSNWVSFKTTLIEAAHGHGVLGYLTDKIINLLTSFAEEKSSIPTALEHGGVQ